jgi:hypothetical protein
VTALVVLEGVVILLLAVLVAGLLRSHAEILRRLHELGAGEPTSSGGGLRVRRGGRSVELQSIAGTTPMGGEIGVALDGSRGLVLLAFLTSGCSSCRVFWEAFRAGAAMPHGDIRPVIVTKSADEESPTTIANLAPRDIATIMSSEAWDAMSVPVAPYFALVDARRGVVVGEGAAGSWDHVSELITRALGDAATRAGRDPAAGTRQRIQDTDAELRSAGIEPGDPSLNRAHPPEGTT